MANKFSDSLRESIVAEKNKVETNPVVGDDKAPPKHLEKSKPLIVSDAVKKSALKSKASVAAKKPLLRSKGSATVKVVSKSTPPNATQLSKKTPSKAAAKIATSATTAKNVGQSTSINKIKSEKNGATTVIAANSKNNANFKNRSKKTIIEMQEELNQAYKNAMNNVNNDLLHYMSCLPMDGNLSELTKVSLSYLQSLHKRHREVLEYSSSFYRELFAVFVP